MRSCFRLLLCSSFVTSVFRSRRVEYQRAFWVGDPAAITWMSTAYRGGLQSVELLEPRS